MNYILGNDRSRVKIECIEDYADSDSEFRVIDYRNIGLWIIKNVTKLIIIENLIKYSIKFILLYIKRI